MYIGVLNLRGNDIAFNPVFFSYLLIPLGHTPTLFIDITQLSDDVYQYITGLGILIEPYDSVLNYLENVGKQLKEGVRSFSLFPLVFANLPDLLPSSTCRKVLSCHLRLPWLSLQLLV